MLIKNDPCCFNFGAYKVRKKMGPVKIKEVVLSISILISNTMYADQHKLNFTT